MLLIIEKPNLIIQTEVCLGVQCTPKPNLLISSCVPAPFMKTFESDSMHKYNFIKLITPIVSHGKQLKLLL